MFAASTYEEIVEYEQRIENKEVVVFLFVKPSGRDAIDIIREFEYIHYNSAKYCSVYAIGYSDDPLKAESSHYKKVAKVTKNDWFFSYKAFVDFKNNLEKRIKREYSGETEVLILQNNPGEIDPLNFSNYVAIDVNKGLREGYIDSFQGFMESLIRSSRSKVKAKEAATDLRRNHISVRDVIAEAIDKSKRIPNSAKQIIKDRLFYRCANNFPIKK